MTMEKNSQVAPAVSAIPEELQQRIARVRQRQGTSLTVVETSATDGDTKRTRTVVAKTRQGKKAAIKAITKASTATEMDAIQEEVPSAATVVSESVREVLRANGRAGGLARARNARLALVERDDDAELPSYGWTDALRALPNIFWRSDLFTVQQPLASDDDEVYVKGKVLHVQRDRNIDVRMRYTGPILTQSDGDGFMAAVQLAKTWGLGRIIAFSSSEFIKAAGKKGNDGDYEWVARVIVRLMSAVVHVEVDGDTVFAEQLIKSYRYDKATKVHYIEIDGTLRNLYGRSQWTGIVLEERRKLRRAYIAQWLHAYYSTHAEPRPLPIAYLHELCGTACGLSEFRRKRLPEAIEKINQVLPGWNMRMTEDDLLVVNRPPSDSQAKWIEESAKAPAKKRAKVA